MIGQEANVIWNSFRALSAVNAIFIAFIGVIYSKIPEFAPLAKIICGLGMFVCLGWLAMSVRAYGYFAYWFACARNYEVTGFGSEINIVNRGQQFARGKRVAEVDQRFSWLGRLVPVRWVIYSVIFTFAVIYGFLVFQEGAAPAVDDQPSAQVESSGE